MMNIINYWSGFNWASFWSVTPTPFEIVLCYGIILFFIFALKGRRWAKTGLLLTVLTVLLIYLVGIWNTLESGPAGDLYRCGTGELNTYSTARQGKDPDRRWGLSGQLIWYRPYGRSTFLFRSKISRIDYIVLSHPHPDHVSGLNFIAEILIQRSSGTTARTWALRNLLNSCNP